jgi:hypothetical protein
MEGEKQTSEGIVRPGMAHTLTVAATQLAPIMADKEKNLKRAKDYIQKAAEKRADIIVFPELYLTGYTCGEQEGLFYDLAEPIPGDTTNALYGYAGSQHRISGNNPQFRCIFRFRRYYPSI